ncbi:unnamed protein product, partial [Ilex paraguariensis]
DQLPGLDGNLGGTQAQPKLVYEVRNVEIPPLPNDHLVNDREQLGNDQGELENRSIMILKEFLKRHPPSLQGTTKPLEAKKWLREVKKVMDAIGIAV